MWPPKIEAIEHERQLAEECERVNRELEKRRSIEQRDALRLEFFKAALQGGSFIVETKEQARQVAESAMCVADAAVEVWCKREQK